MTDESKRKMWKRKILKKLRSEGPQRIPDLMDKLDVPSEERRTFYRAISDLREIDVIRGEHILHTSAQEEPTEVRLSVGPRALRITVPLSKELAKRVLNKRPRIKRRITRRKGVIYELLSELGILEE